MQPPAGGGMPVMPPVDMGGKGKDSMAGVSEGVPIVPPADSGAVDDFQARLDALKNL